MDVGALLGGIGKSILGAVTGGLSDRVVELVEAVLPNGLSAEQKLALKQTVEAETTKREMAAHQAAAEAERNLTERIAVLEGTAKDLMGVPVVGKIVLFVRGAQRPAWGIGVLYLDYMVFSKQWPLDPETVTESAFWLINFLVLGFLFGERAMQNVMPAVALLLEKRRA